MQDSMRLVSAALLPGMVCMPLALATPGVAQVMPDGTLGNEGSVVTPLDASTDRIDGGAVRDSLLFHSFEAFSIPDGHGVYFANPELVNTIFSRVTGADPSLLFGTLGVLGDADLMFINPNGIVFGPNAELDLRGAFTATTATGVVFPGGEVFSALEPEAAPLLTVNVEAPVGVVFEGEMPGAISNFGNLTVESGQALTLIGGEIANTGNLQAPDGSIAIVAAPGNTGVQFEENSRVQSWSKIADSPIDFAGQSVAVLMDTAELDVDALPVDASLFESGTAIVSSELDAASDAGVGGDVWVLGDRIALLDTMIDTSGLEGGGEVLIGGEYRGQGNLPTASRTFVDAATTIDADARQEGDGGTVILWADGDTQFYGDISSRGGETVGDGGFVEVSGATQLSFFGNADTGAVNGITGKLLLDPTNITISDIVPIGFTPVGNMAEVFNDFAYTALENQGQNSYISPNDVETLLTLNSLVLEATETINIDSNIVGENFNSLTFKASNININDAIIVQFGGGDLLFQTPQTLENVITVSGNNKGIASIVEKGDILDGGNIKLQTGNLSILGGAQITSSTNGRGDAGEIEINTSESVTVEGRGSFISSQVGVALSPINIVPVGTGAAGNSGRVDINTNNLRVIDGAIISVSTFEQGDSGTIDISAADKIIIQGEGSSIVSQVGSTAQLGNQLFGAFGNGGEILLSANAIDVIDGGQISASTFGQGNAGNINIETSNSLILEGSGSSISSQVNSTSRNGNLRIGAIGDGGNINISGNVVVVRNGGAVSVSTFGEGDAGKIIVEANESILLEGDLSGVVSQISPEAVGDSKGIEFSTNRLIMRDGAIIGADSFGRGDTGKVIIDAAESVWISGENTGIGSAIDIGAVGNSNGIEISTGDFLLEAGSQISASTFGQGNAGRVRVNANDTFRLSGDGSAVTSAVANVNAIGNSDGIEIIADMVSVENMATLETSTAGNGTAGDVMIDAGSISFSNGRILSRVLQSSSASNENLNKGGNINISAAYLALTEGSFFDASTNTASNPNFPGSGNGGSINIGLNSTENSTEGVLLDESSLLVRSESTGLAGNVDIQGFPQVSLDNESSLLADSFAVNGGNIILRDIGVLTMRRASLISAEAGQQAGSGNGGNITIQSDFIFAVPQENSDIIANAFSGNGGRVNIEAIQVFGIEFRDGLTPLSDITASSAQGEQGIVIIAELDTDPTQGIDALPNEPQGPEVIEGCAVQGNTEAVGFFDLGRGGRLPGPDDLITTDATIVEWTSLDLIATDSEAGESARSPLALTPAPYLLATCGSLADEYRSPISLRKTFPVSMRSQ